MLVLSRRVGESVVIGDDIVITILEYRGDVVRIGVDAPRHVQVRRAELLTELAETNRAAASPGDGAVAGLSRLVSGSDEPRRDATEEPDADGGAEPDADAGPDAAQQPPPGPRTGGDRPRPRPPRPGPPPTE